MSLAEIGIKDEGLGECVTDLGLLLGQDARGLNVLGAVYKPGPKIGQIMDSFPAVAQNGLKTQVLLNSQHPHTPNNCGSL